MAQFDPVVIPVSADVQEVERAFKRVAQSADKTAKSVENSFTNAFKNIGRSSGGIGAGATAAAGAGAGAAVQGARGFLGKAGGAVGKTAGAFFALSDIRDALEYLGSAGKYLATPASQLKSFAQTAAASSQQIISSLGQISLAFQGLQGTIGLATSALSGFFNATVGREIKFRETILNIQTTIASTSRVFDKTGAEITKPLEKIRALEKPVREAIRNIVKESENISGTTSEDIIQLFQLITTYSGQAKLDIEKSQKLAVKFAAGFGTLGIKPYEAPQEIGSILSGQITDDSKLAKKLGITPAEVEKAKQSAGGLFDYLSKKLETVLAGQDQAAKGFAGLTSNIQEVAQNVQQAFGKPILDPILDGLNQIYSLITGTKEQFKAAAEAAGALVGKLSTSVIGGAFKGASNAVNSVRAELGKTDVRQQGAAFLQRLENSGATIGRTLENVLTAAGEKLDTLVASFGKLAVTIAQLKLEQFTTSIQTLGTVTLIYLQTSLELQGTFIKIKATLLQLLGPLANFATAFKAVRDTLDPLIRAGVSLGLLLKGPLTAAIKAVLSEAKALATGATTLAETWGKVTGAFTKVIEVIDKGTKPLRDFGAALKAGFQEGVSANAAKQAAQSFAEVKTAVTGAGEAAAKAGPAFKVIAETASETATGVKTARTEINLLVEAGGAGAKVGALLGKSFAALGPIFSGLVGIAKTLVVQLFAVQAVTAAVEAVVTVAILAYQNYQDTQKALADQAKRTADAEAVLTGNIEKGTKAREQRRREEQLANTKDQRDVLEKGRKQAQEILASLNSKDKGGAKNVASSLLGLIRGEVFSSKDYQPLLEALKNTEPDFIDKVLKFKKNNTNEATKNFITRFLGDPETVKRIGAELDKVIDKIDNRVEKETKQTEASRIETAAKTALDTLASAVQNTANTALNTWNEVVGALQAKLASLAPNSQEFGKIEAALALAKANLQEAGKSVADRFIEAKQSAITIAKTILDGEDQARAIRRETQREVRQSVLAGIDEETAALVDQLDQKKTQEEDIQSRIKKSQLDIAEISAKIKKDEIEKTLIIQGLYQAIAQQLKETADYLAAAAKGAASDLQNLGGAGNKPSGDFKKWDPALLRATAVIDQKYRVPVGTTASLFMFESSGSTSIQRTDNGATGLFQVIPDTARELGTNTDRIKKMSGVAQTALFDKYLQKRGFKPGMSPLQMYATVLAGNPRDVDSSDGYTTPREGAEVQAGYRNLAADAIKKALGAEGIPLNLDGALPANQRNSSNATTNLLAGGADLSSIARNAKGLTATLGIDRDIAQLDAQRAAIDKTTEALKEQLAVVSKIDLLKRREDQEKFKTKSEALKLEADRGFERKRLEASTIEDKLAREQKEIQIQAEEQVYKSIGFKIDEIKNITVPLLTKKLQTEKDPKARKELANALDAAGKLQGLFEKVLADNIKLAVDAFKLEAEKAQNKLLIDSRTNLQQLKRLLKIDRSGSDIDQQLGEFFAQDGVREGAELGKTKREEFTTRALEEAKRRFGTLKRGLEEESTFRGLASSGLSKRDVAILRQTAEQYGGLTNFQQQAPGVRKQALNENTRLYGDQESLDAQDRLDKTQQQIDLERIKLKELTAVSNEDRAQVELERELLSLKQQGKELTPEEQQRFKLLQLQNLELQTQIDLANQLKGGFQNFFGEVGAGFLDALSTGRDFFEGLQNAAANFFQSIGKYLLDLAAQKASSGLLDLVGGLFGAFGGGGFDFGGGAVGNAVAAGGRDSLVSGGGLLSGVVLSANGNVLKGGFKAFATGGIVNTPTLGLIGEGTYNEAVVPLPDGRSIPVSLGGAFDQNRRLMAQQAADAAAQGAAEATASMFSTNREAMAKYGLPGTSVTNNATNTNSTTLTDQGTAPLSLSFNTTRVYNEEFVRVEDLQAALKATRQQAVVESTRQTFDRLRNSPGTRRSVGV